MFSKKNRFSFKGKLPRNVFHSYSFTVRYDRNEDGLRIAVVVSKKVDKRATARNRIKRKLIDIIQKNMDKYKPLNLVFYIRKQAQFSEDLEDEVNKFLSHV